MRIARTNRRSTARPGFTLIEVMLALVLAAFVVVAAMGVLSLAVRAQATHAGDIARSVRIAQAQSFFRDSFVRLVAGVPLVEESEDEATPTDEEANGDEAEAIEDEQDEPGNFEQLLDDLLEGDMASQLLAENAEQLDAMFEIYLDDTAPGWPLPVLECVVTDPPNLARDTAFITGRSVLDELGFVRGRVTLEPQRDGLYTLVYVPLDPIGETVAIIRDLEWASFHVLPSKNDMGWVELYAAYLQEDFPAAIRVVLFTPDGREIDWLFEVQSVVPEAGR